MDTPTDLEDIFGELSKNRNFEFVLIKKKALLKIFVFYTKIGPNTKEHVLKQCVLNTAAKQLATNNTITETFFRLSLSVFVFSTKSLAIK